MGDKSDDIEKLKAALGKEREERKAATAALKTAQARVAELEQASALGDNPSAAQVSQFISEAVTARLATETAELQRKLGTLEAQLNDATTAQFAVEAKLTRRTIDDAIRAAAIEAHVKPDAMADVLTIAGLELKLTENGDVLTPDGLDVHAWLDARKATSSYWWPTAISAGARGSGDGGAVETDNPFAPGASWSLTRQGEILRASPERATMLLQQAAAMPRN